MNLYDVKVHVETDLISMCNIYDTSTAAMETYQFIMKPHPYVMDHNKRLSFVNGCECRKSNA